MCLMCLVLCLKWSGGGVWVFGWWLCSVMRNVSCGVSMCGSLCVWWWCLMCGMCGGFCECLVCV